MLPASSIFSLEIRPRLAELKKHHFYNTAGFCHEPPVAVGVLRIGVFVAVLAAMEEIVADGTNGGDKTFGIARHWTILPPQRTLPHNLSFRGLSQHEVGHAGIRNDGIKLVAQ